MDQYCVERQALVNPNTFGSKVLLKKSLGQYFDERMGEKIDLYEEKYKDMTYAVGMERVAAQHAIACLDNQLANAREIEKREKITRNLRWEQAEDKHCRVWQRCPQFDAFYKENQVKRQRSLHTAEVERRRIIEKERELRRCRKDFAKLEIFKEEVENRLEKFWMFKTYLEKTKETSQGEYPDVRELMDRYGVLANARHTLMTKNQFFRNTVAQRQKAMQNNMIVKSNEVLAYRNYLSELLDYDSLLQEQVFRLNDSLLRIKTTAAQRTLVIGQIKMAVHNLYNGICRSMRRHAKLKPENTLGQLLDVRISIKEISRLSKDIRRMLKAAHLTAKAEHEAREKLKKMADERQKRIDKIANTHRRDVGEIFKLPKKSAKLSSVLVVKEGKKSQAPQPLVVNSQVLGKKSQAQALAVTFEPFEGIELKN